MNIPFRIQKQYDLQVSYLFHSEITLNGTTAKREQDLHIFIPNHLQLHASIQQFIDLYSTRKRTDRESWILDVSYWMTSSKSLGIYRPYHHEKKRNSVIMAQGPNSTALNRHTVP